MRLFSGRISLQYDMPEGCDDRRDKLFLCRNGKIFIQLRRLSFLQHLFAAVQTLYPDHEIWLTGHSLGGALAALTSFAMGSRSGGAIAFQAPGERLYAQRVGLLSEKLPPEDQSRIFHVGHNADPIFMGTCAYRSGACYYAGYAIESVCRLGMSATFEAPSGAVAIHKHTIKYVINEVLHKADKVPDYLDHPSCKDCIQWEYRTE